MFVFVGLGSVWTMMSAMGSSFNETVDGPHYHLVISSVREKRIVRGRDQDYSVRV